MSELYLDYLIVGSFWLLMAVVLWYTLEGPNAWREQDRRDMDAGTKPVVYDAAPKSKQERTGLAIDKYEEGMSSPSILGDAWDEIPANKRKDRL